EGCRARWSRARVPWPARSCGHRWSAGGAGNPGDLRRSAGRDRMHDPFLGRRRALVDAEVAAEAKDGDAVRGLEDVVQVVRDQDDAESLFGQAVHQGEHLLGLRDSERRPRLLDGYET